MSGGEGAPQHEVLIVAGEVSGDLHAHGLLREFRKLHPQVHFFGVGGHRMAAEGCEILFPIEKVAFLGLAEVIAHLPFIRKMMKTLLWECLRRRPKAVVLIDYPGFNLRFAKRLRRTPGLSKTPILYYISPQVWAWHASRVPKIARLVNRMAVIFDFEALIYGKAGLKTDFVGHPLLEVVQARDSSETFRQNLGLLNDDTLLALLPGSRMQEIKRLLPLFLETYRKVKMGLPNLKAAIGCSPAVDQTIYENHIEQNTESIPLLYGKTYDLLAHSSVALVASGTATLEAAILGTPMVMAYKVAPLTYWIGRHLVKIPDIALVNVVAGRRVIPEFVQGEASSQRIAAELRAMLDDESRRRTMMEDLAQVRAKLGEPGASAKVASILSEMIMDDANDAR